MTHKPPLKQCPSCDGHGWRILDYDQLAARVSLWATKVTVWAVPCFRCDGRRVVPVDEPRVIAEKPH